MKRIGIFCANEGCENLATETGGLCLECQRLAAVRELVENCALEGMWAKTCRDMAIESLRAVWPEAVEE